MRIVLLGAPGSGKGTQGPRLAERLGVPYLSTGELLRREAAAGTDLGARVTPYLERGELVPDDLTLEIVDRALAGGPATTGFVLDGFPRTLAQAEMLEATGSALPAPDLAGHISIPDDVVHRRLAKRADEEGRRDDADPDVIARRLAVYRDETEPLLAHYRDRDALITVDGDGTPDEVSARLLAALSSRG